MNAFTNTVGFDPSRLQAFFHWLLTFFIVFFAVTVIRGSYQRWVDKKISAVDVLIELVLVTAVMIIISIFIG